MIQSPWGFIHIEVLVRGVGGTLVGRLVVPENVLEQNFSAAGPAMLSGVIPALGPVEGVLRPRGRGSRVSKPPVLGVKAPVNGISSEVA